MIQGKEAAQSPAAIRRKRFKVFAAILIALALIVGVYWLLTRNDESTDDAFIDGNVAGVAPQVGGRVIAVHFSDNDEVKAGDLLVEIDPRDFEAALAAAKANLEAAIARRDGAEATLELVRVTSGADYTRAQSALAAAREQVGQSKSTAEALRADAERAATDAKRYQELWQGHNASRQRLDMALADERMTSARLRAAEKAVSTAEAQVAQAIAQLQAANTARQQVAAKEAELALAKAGVDKAQADLDTAALNLSYTKLVAPAAGRLSKKAVTIGDTVQRGQVLTQMVVGDLWVVANFKETQLTKMRQGQPAAVRVDAFPSLKLKGHVDSFQPGTGARFSLLPAENATGNFVKVVQRVPVKIVIDQPEEAPFLALGMSVVPTVDVGAAPTPKGERSR